MGEEIPQARIRLIKGKSAGQIVWMDEEDAQTLVDSKKAVFCWETAGDYSKR